MKILHVVPTYLPAWSHGGPVAAVHGLCRALAARQHQVTVFTTAVEATARPRQPVWVEGVEVWYFPLAAPRHLWRRLYRSPALAAALEQNVSKFDLVHLHSVFLWPTYAAARAAARFGVPYVVAPRGMLVRELLNRRGKLRKRLWIRCVERRTLAEAAFIHATSELEQDDVLDLGLRLRRVEVVPNGVDIEPWSNARRPELGTNVRDALDHQPLLLFLGRVSWKKGLDLLLLALKDVPNTTLAIAGYDNEGYWKRLERQANEIGVRDRVRYLGPVHGADKAGLLHEAAALVLPSLSENFGNVVLEAMAAGLPVVVTPEVGLAEAVRLADAGVVVKSDPPAGLAARLRELVSDPEKRRAMGRRGKTAARRFAWDTVAAEMEAAYEKVADQRCRAPRQAERARGAAS